MPTLNKTTFYTKEFLKWGGILCVCIFLLITLFRISVRIKEYFFPTPPPPPTVSFGKLPAISFPDPPVKGKFTYDLQTLSGNLPVFSDRATVYQITSPTSNLLNSDRAKEKVAAVGFADQTGKALPERKIGPATYQWQDQTSLQRILTMDIDSFNFTLTSSYTNDQDVLNGVNLPTESNAVEVAQKFINSLGLFGTDIDPSRTTTGLLTLKENSVSSATSFSTANLIRVNFFQKDANGLHMVYPYPPYSLISIIVAGGTSTQGQVVEAKYIHRDVTSSSATYPIKTAALAFDELKQGKAYIAEFNGSGNKVTIRNVSLGYFIGDGVQDYLLPVVIFEGDNDFTAYVSATSDTWIK